MTALENTYVAPELAALWSMLTQGPKAARIRKVTAVLRSPGGDALRAAAARGVTQLLPAEALVPETYERWRPIVSDALEFVFTRLSDRRLAEKLVEQAALPADSPAPVRLLVLISRMPGIQKLGQVLARHRHLGQDLRKALSELENGLSDVNLRTIRGVIDKQLGPMLRRHGVRIEQQILCEASVSAIVGFTWRNPESGKREAGVFKVRKPYVEACFAEDLSLLQQWSVFLAAGGSYGFATHDVAELVSEVRTLLEHELDFENEQTTLQDALRTYRLTLGVRIPRLIAPLCTPQITAMTRESGVKITEAFPGQTYRRLMVAEQAIEALIAVPLLSLEKDAVLHADPHAGNLLYDEERRELVILDWALTERLSREARRQLAMLVIMTILRNARGAADAILRLTSARVESGTEQARLIRSTVAAFFEELPSGSSPGSSEALQLLDRIALSGVRFPASLAMFQKALFTLDGVLYDIAGANVPVSRVLVRDFVVRGLASFGLNIPPLSISDLMAVQRSALLYPARWGASALRNALTTEIPSSTRESKQ